MQTNDKEIAKAIAQANQTMINEVYNIAKLAGIGPEKVVRFYNGSILGLWEIKAFVAWKKRLPDDKESHQVAQYGIPAMKTLFK